MDDDDSWVDEARLDAGPCPSCGAAAALPIVYGMPAYDFYERLQGKVVFAGCCTSDSDPLYRCAACSATWGRRTYADIEPVGSPFDELD